MTRQEAEQAAFEAIFEKYQEIIYNTETEEPE